MKAVPDAAFDSRDAFGLISENRHLIFGGMALCLTLFVAASYVIPKKFKSHFALTIYAQYFQNPLIRDFIPEVSDFSEMRSQRESLIRQAMTPTFLDALRDKYGMAHAREKMNLPPWAKDGMARLKALALQYGLYQPAKKGSEEAAAREELLSRITIVNLNNTTFSVSFVYPDPEVTWRATQDIHAQVIATLLQAHINNLVNVRDAIRQRVESLSFHMSAPPDPRASLRPQVVSEELADIRNQIRALSAQYTEDHPTMIELRDREKILSRWHGVAPQGYSGHSSDAENAVVSGQSTEGAKDIYNDLMKKLNYLNIALEADKTHQGDYFADVESPLFPESPLWPKRGLLALWGLALGFVGSLSIAALREYFKRTTLRAGALAEQLGVPLLGELPVVRWNASVKAANPR